ncbi:MAG: DUF4956 domain-containing protein [Longimicrobiales bacterium]
MRRSRNVPFAKLILFYFLLVGIAAIFAHYFPAVRASWLAPTHNENAQVVQSIQGDRISGELALADTDPVHRALATLLITIGALALSLPVAWVYTFTRRFRFDPSLVQSIIILPMVVAGIVLIVKNSVALAFSLAGIVAGVRFRNTLKDPQDAVYIFLALGIGLAAGVRASDVALITSFLFNMVVLIVWKYKLAAVYGGSVKGSLFAFGDPTLWLATGNESRDRIRGQVAPRAKDMDADGILLVHTDDPDAAVRGAELCVARVAKDWRIVPEIRRRQHVSTFAVLMELDGKKGNPLNLLSELDEEFSGQINSAEYIPYHDTDEADESED